MLDKVLILAAIILLFTGVVSIYMAREFIRKKSSVDNENVVVRNFKLIGFIVVIISLLTIYFCKLGGV